MSNASCHENHTTKVMADKCSALTDSASDANMKTKVKGDICAVLLVAIQIEKKLSYQRMVN